MSCIQHDLGRKLGEICEDDIGPRIHLGAFWVAAGFEQETNVLEASQYAEGTYIGL
jgi:hypothetical protein